MEAMQKFLLPTTADGDSGSVCQYQLCFGCTPHIDQIDHIALVGSGKPTPGELGYNIFQCTPKGQAPIRRVKHDLVSLHLCIADILHLQYMGDAIQYNGQTIASQLLFDSIQCFRKRF